MTYKGAPVSQHARDRGALATRRRLWLRCAAALDRWVAEFQADRELGAGRESVETRRARLDFAARCDTRRWLGILRRDADVPGALVPPPGTERYSRCFGDFAASRQSAARASAAGETLTTELLPGFALDRSGL